jgi:hypothetical protein
MSTYDNLNIATVSLTFSGALDPSISSRTFDLSTLSFLPNVPLIDQIEVERIFDTGYDTKFGANVFTIADRREMFVLPKNWYSINEQTKLLTVVDLSTIPTALEMQTPEYYPNSRTYVLQELDSNGNTQTIDIPTFLVNNVGIDTPYVRQPDIVIIRRKTLSLESIVTFAPGTRLTTTQLNLQFNQLKNLIQELIAKIKNETILKFDENAIDGPFLGGSDLKMSNNFIKDLNSKSIGEVNTQFTSITDGNVFYTGSTFAANIGVVYDALTQGTVRRTIMNGGTAVPFSGHFTATPDGGSPLKITNMADATADTDATTFRQIKNASNLSTGTISPTVLGTNSIPLTKLETTNAGNYVLPSSALEGVNATIGTFGQSSPTNSNNMLRVVTDNKGRITSISHRTLGNGDLPDTTVTASTYGDSSTPLVQLTVNSKGLITAASERVIAANDLPNVNATNLTSGTVPLIRLPTDNVTFSGTQSIPNSITVDTYGRVTAVAGGSILASNVSDFNASSVSLIQANAPYWDSANSVFTALRSGVATKIRNIGAPTDNTDAVTLGYLNGNALVVSNNQISASNYPIKNLAMSAAPASTDAANVGYVLGLSLYGSTPTIPQTITKSFPSSIADGALYRYEFTFTNGSSDNLESPTAEMLIVVDSDNKTYTPVTTATALGCQLDVGSTTKTLKVWLTVSSMSSKTLSVRNFGVSRIVSSGPATASSLGLVSVPVSGGIAVNNGEITLATATTSQIGGIRLSTGLVSDGGQLVKVDLSDDTNLSNSTKAASSKAVKDLRDLSVLKTGSTMTGGLVLAANTTTVIPLQFTSAASDPLSPSNGSMWLISDALKFRASSGTKTVAFTDSNITGTASAWTTGRTIEVTGDVTGTSPSITGATNVTGWSLTTNPATNVKSVTGTTNRITATKNNTTGDVTLTLPQDIHTSATPTFGSVTANGVQVGSAANTISVATSNANLTLAGNGTGNVTISTPASLSGTLTVTGTTTLNGNVTLGSTANLTLSNSAASITLASSGTSINNASAAVSGIAAIGDMYLRVPVTTGKAFVIKGTGNPAETDQIITQGTLSSTLNNYATTASLGSYMATSGTLVTGSTSQVLGTGASATGSFIVRTANTDRLTINAAGTTSLTNGLSVTGAIAATGKITSAATVSGDVGTTVATKGYVDALAALAVKTGTEVGAFRIAQVSAIGSAAMTINAQGPGANWLSATSTISQIRPSVGTWTMYAVFGGSDNDGGTDLSAYSSFAVNVTPTSGGLSAYISGTNLNTRNALVFGFRTA